MSTKITDIADVRQGDIVVIEYNGHRLKGKTWMANGALRVGADIIRFDDGSVPHSPRFIKAKRKKPTLPTSLSLIHTIVSGVDLHLIGPDVDGDWRGTGSGYITPDQIDDFEILWTEE